MPKPGNHSSQTQVLEHDDTGGVYRKRVSAYGWDTVNSRPVKFGSDPNGNQYTNIVEPLDMLGNLATVSRSPVVELKSTYGLSNLRDITTTTGSATVTNSVGNPEYTLSTGTTTSSVATLDSSERGRYLPGAQGQAGIGVRMPDQTFTGTAYAEWGYFDDNDGFGFGKDATGLYVFVLRNGSKTKVHQAGWNIDKMDGTGNSGITLNIENGNIFQIDFIWYGFGPIRFSIINPSTEKKYSLHQFVPTNQTSVLNPNLPLRGVVSNGGTTTDYDLYLAGRQYSVLSPFKPNNRINSEMRLSLSSVGTTFLPTVSFRKKTTYKSVSVKVEGIDILSDADLVYQLRLNPSLTNASYTTPTNTTATETACEVDTSATAISGGELLTRGLVDVTGGVGVASGSVSKDVLNYVIPEEQPLTLAVRRVSGTNATVSVVLRWREEW